MTCEWFTGISRPLGIVVLFFAGVAYSQTPTVSLQISSNPLMVGGAATLTATVTRSIAGATVTFFDGQSQLGSAIVSTSGKAVFSTVLLQPGRRTLRAALVIPANQNAALSAPVIENVTAAAGGSFAAWVPMPAAANPNATVIADFNGDGHPDIAAADFGSNQISILLGDGTGRFQPTAPLATDLRPVSLVAADVNGDGFTDLLVTNGAGTVGVYLGNGNGSFHQVAGFRFANPYSIAVADFNGDGIVDIVVTSYTGGFATYLGNGDGSFRPGTSLDSVQTAGHVTIGDFNGDGLADLATTSQTGENVQVYLGKGDGTFGTALLVSPPGPINAITTGDFNGDGKLDLAITSFYGEGVGIQLVSQVLVYIGNGDGTFTAGGIYSVPANPTAIAPGDFYGRGFTDLVVTSHDNATVTLLSGNGDGTFNAGPSFATGAGPQSVTVADLNGDGLLDLVVADGSGGEVSVLLGSAPKNPPPTSTQVVGASIFSSEAAQVLTLRATVNGPAVVNSGMVTFTVTNGASSVGIPVTVPVVNGAGVGEYTIPSGTPPGIYSLTATYSGLPDFGPSSDSTQQVTVGPLRAASTITLSSMPSYSTLGASVTLVATVSPVSASGFVQFFYGAMFAGGAAVNGGAATLVTTSLPAGVHMIRAMFLGSTAYQPSTAPSVPLTIIPVSAGGFAAGQMLSAYELPTSAYPVAFVSADFNGDGIPDLAVANSTDDISELAGSVVVLLGNGDGTFRQGASLVTGGTPLDLRVADFNADGFPDLAVLNGPPNFLGGSNISVLLGNGDGTFQTAITTGGSPQWLFGGEALVLADFNGDGLPDIAAVTSPLVFNAQTGTAAVLLGKGDGSFYPPISFVVPCNPGSIVAGDFNNDGLDDLAFGVYTVPASQAPTGVCIMNGDGGGTMQPGSFYATGFGVNSLWSGDVNGDGLADLVVAGTATSGDGQVTVFRGTPSGALVPGATVTVGGNMKTVTVADVNGDGFADVVVSTDSVTGPALSVLLGDADGNFPNPATSLSACYTSQLVTADFSGQGRTDLAAVCSSGSDTGIEIFQNTPPEVSIAVTGISSSVPLGQGYPIAITASGGSISSVSLFDGTALLGSASLTGDQGNFNATFSNQGEHWIRAVFEGSGNYPASASPFLLVTVVGTPQTITFAAIAPHTFGDPPFAVSATAGGSGNPVVFSVLSGPATLNGAIVTLTGAGSIVLQATQAGSASYQAATATIGFAVQQASQTITFPAIAPQNPGASFTLAATASSSLPIAFSVISGPAQLNQSILTLTGIGLVTVQASQAGSQNYFAAASVTQSFEVSLGNPQIAAVVNAASYGSTVLAPNSYIALFGSNLATTAASGNPALTTQLAGLSVAITDITGNHALAGLGYAGLQQVNFVVPGGLASGAGMLVVTNASGNTANFAVTIGPVSPGLFTANASGAGVAAGSGIGAEPGGGQTNFAIASCGGSPYACSAVPIPLSGAPGPVYLVLYGTGFRAATHTSATIGGVPCNVAYAGAQGTYLGFDQLNIQIDPSLAGLGNVTVLLTVDGTQANPVQISVQ